MRRIRLAILTPLLVCGACTELKAVTATTTSPAPAASVKVAAESPPPGFADASPSPTPAAGVSTAPVVLPTLRPATQVQPEPSFTPAIIIPLGGLKTPVPCPSGTTCASPVPTATPTFAPGVTPPPVNNVSPQPGTSAAPSAGGSAIPSTARITVANVAGGAIDRFNNLWLGNSATKRVSVFTGDAPQGVFDVDNPPGALAFDKDGNAWVQAADLGSVVELSGRGARIDKYTLTLAVGDAASKSRPGLAAVPTGGMWVANGGGANTVVRLDEKGKVVTTLECSNGVAAIACDGGGNVYVIGFARGTDLQKFSPAGTPLGTFTDFDGLEDPKAAKLDKDGNLWVIGRHTVLPKPTEGYVVKLSALGQRIATIPTGVDHFPIAFDLGLQDDIVVANGANGLSKEHAGFQRVTAAGGVKAEKFYDSPTDVLVDKNGDVWGINAQREAFRFKLDHGKLVGPARKGGKSSRCASPPGVSEPPGSRSRAGLTRPHTADA